MTQLRKLSGELVAKGPSVHDGALAPGSEPATFYDYIRLEDEHGNDAYIERVTIPAYLDSLLAMGTPLSLHVAVVPLPTLFGTKPLSLVYAVEIGGKVRRAIEQTQRLMSIIKRPVIQLILVGFLLILVWGAGLLFWIQASRLMAVALPLEEMRKT